MFWNITYLGTGGILLFLLAYGSVLWQRRKLPRLVKGGIRHNLTFYPLSNEEEQVLTFLRQNLSASTDELISIFSGKNRSFSQTHKLKADAIDDINNLLKSSNKSCRNRFCSDEGISSLNNSKKNSDIYF